MSDLVAKGDNGLDTEVKTKLDATVAAMSAMKARAESIEAYDQMIGSGNKEGNAVVQAAIDALLDQTKSIEAAVSVLELDTLEFEGSDSLDDPSKVFE